MTRCGSGAPHCASGRQILLTDWWRHGRGKSPWRVTVFGRWEARSATEAAVDPSLAKRRTQGAKIPDERRASISLRDGATRGTPLVDRRKKKRKYDRKGCTGSALAPMPVGVSAEPKSAWMRRSVTATRSSKKGAQVLLFVVSRYPLPATSFTRRQINCARSTFNLCEGRRAQPPVGPIRKTSAVTVKKGP